MSAEESFEERFFAQCAHQRRLTLHREGRAADLHAIFYTTTSLMELELFRLVDWIIDLPLPGNQLQPCHWTVDGIRHAYHRMGTSTPWRRVGELVDALQIPELSLGDVAATYSSVSGGTVSAGSGTMLRANKLIDWTQRMVGDVNAVSGRVVGSRRGLVPWSGPGRAIDGAQWLVTEVFHRVSVLAVRSLDYGLTGIERVAEAGLNLGWQAPHRTTTVFLRMSAATYETCEPWIRRHRRRMHVGTEEELRRISHADLFHPRSRRRLSRRSLDDEFQRPAWVILVTDRRTFATAPTDLKPYVIPVTWFDE